MRCTILLVALVVGLSAATAGTVPDWAVAVFPSGAEFSLEIADTDVERQRGYMFRQRVPPHQGMLFLFGATERHGIWMKNCLVSLDIIWLDGSFRVVEIFAEAQPCLPEGPCPSMKPMRAADYVLEIAGGRAAEENLRPGDVVIIHAEPSLP